MLTPFLAFKKLVEHPFKFSLFLLANLPSAYFSGVRIIKIEEEYCEVLVPYKWFSKNPFRSTYFACLSMAAEMSTGALAMAHLYKKNPAVSMLVVKAEGEFFKKATGETIFSCDCGYLIKKMIEESILSGEAKTAIAKSIGKNAAGEIVAVFYFTWSFKAKR